MSKGWNNCFLIPLQKFKKTLHWTPRFFGKSKKGIELGWLNSKTMRNNTWPRKKYETKQEVSLGTVSDDAFSTKHLRRVLPKERPPTSCQSIKQFYILLTTKRE